MTELERQHYRHVEELIKSLFKVEQERIVPNPEILVLLINFFPKIMIKALKLIEFESLKIIIYEEEEKNSVDFDQIIQKVHRFYFRDVIYQDNDSDDEFIENYNNQKKVYERRDKVFRFKPDSYGWDSDMTNSSSIETDLQNWYCECGKFQEELSVKCHRPSDIYHHRQGQLRKMEQVFKGVCSNIWPLAFCEHLLGLLIVKLHFAKLRRGIRIESVTE